MNAAKTYGDLDLRIVGHLAATVVYFSLGDPIKTREHADRVLVLYSEERHGHLVGVLNHDPKTVSLVWPALSTWMLGYPEQALRISDAAHDHARRRGHPFNLGWALTFGAQVFDCLREPDELLKRAAEADRVGRENSLPFLTGCLVPLYSGIALIRKGRTAEGVALLEKSLAVYEQGGNLVWNPCYKSVLAEGLAQLGDLDRALDLVDEAIAQVERPGWEERWSYAEILRVKGWMLTLNGDPAGAERAFIASLDWARQQQAKSWELRTATSYARLMREQGRVGRGIRTARAGLRLVHRRFRHKGPEGRQGIPRGTRFLPRPARGERDGVRGHFSSFEEAAGIPQRLAMLLLLTQSR